MATLETFQMKSFRRLAVLAIFAVCASTAFAAISGPTGLAVDSKGNLYIANFNSNAILVYSPAHKLLNTRTVTASVSGPLGVAVDPLGNLWVANFSSNSITGYTPTGKLFQTITNGVSGPTALAIDGSGNFWVVNNAQTLTIYDVNGTLVRSSDVSALVSGANVLYSVFAYDGAVILGNNAELFQMYETTYMVTGGAGGVISPYREGILVAYDATGRDWEVESDGTVYLYGTLAIISLGYRPSGMVIDNPHKLVYFSNDIGNSVDVYTMSGAYVTTLLTKV